MGVPSLRDTQRWLAGIILDPTALEAGALDASGTLAADAPTARIRLGAYAGGYPARLEESLGETFPALRHVLGADTVHRLVHRHLPHVPAGIYNLNDVGETLPDWLATDEVAAAMPLATDLARLELAVQRAFHATLLPEFDPAPLAAWTLDEWDRAVLRFQSGVALVRSPWPVHDVWAARKLPRDTIDIVVEGRPQDVLVYRAGFRVAAEVVTTDEVALLEPLLAGETLGGALAGAETPAPSGDAVTRWLAGWVARGLVAGCER
jgi:hypothetical protein